jgi:cell division protein FtsW
MARARTQATKRGALAAGLRQLNFEDLARRVASSAQGPDPSVYANALFGVVLALMAIGFLVQASHAATIQGVEDYHGELISQALFRVGGIAALAVGYRFGPSGVRRFLPLLMVVACLMLIAVYVPGLRAEVNGSKRWLELGALTFQPSEVARVVLVLWVADRCTRLGESTLGSSTPGSSTPGSSTPGSSMQRSPMLGFRRGVLPMLLASFVFFGLVLGETDLGGSLLMLLCALMVMWVGGAQFRSVAVPAIVVGGGAIAGLAAFIPYVRHRIAVFFHQAQNDQVSDTFNAIAHGGPLGVGIGNGPFRNAGVPYLDSDYVFAQLGEEFGALGMFVVLGLALSFMWFSLRLVLSLRDRYDGLCAFGLLISVCLQGMIHCQVVARLAPAKGMTLPFISDGGTSLIVSSLAVGLALGAARRVHQENLSCNPSNATAS